MVCSREFPQDGQRAALISTVVRVLLSRSVIQKVLVVKATLPGGYSMWQNTLRSGLDSGTCLVEQFPGHWVRISIIPFKLLSRRPTGLSNSCYRFNYKVPARSIFHLHIYPSEVRKYFLYIDQQIFNYILLKKINSFVIDSDSAVLKRKLIGYSNLIEFQFMKWILETILDFFP